MRVWTCVLVALLAVTPSLSRADDTEDRIEALEKKQAELYHTLAERKKVGVGARISENVTMSGLIEVEIIWEEVDNTGKSDIELASVQLGFEASVTEELGAILVLEFVEDGNDSLNVDEATIDYSRDPWSLRLGIMDLPTGYFPSHMLSGPLTEDLGETGETAILVEYEGDALTVSGWLANGDLDEAGDEDHIDDLGLSVMISPSEDLHFGVSYFTDMADTDAELELKAAPEYTDRVAGLSAFFVLGVGGFEVLVEYLGAADDFHVNDLDEEFDGVGDGNGDSPSAWNVEIAYDLREDLEFALRAGGSSEWVDEPETQYGVDVSYGVWENVSVSAEYLHDKFDSAFSSDRVRDTVTTQIAVEF